MNKLTIVIYSITAMLMIGCTQAKVEPPTLTPESTDTAVPTEIAEATDLISTRTAIPPTDIPATSTITRTPTLAISLTPTPILPTPSLPLSSATEFRFSEFFFDNSNYPTCELPCWKGLVIGESSREDVQHMLDTEFGIEGTERLNYSWFIDSERGLKLDMLAWMHDNSYSGIMFEWVVKRTMPVDVEITPRDFLEHLGEPDEMRVKALEGTPILGILDLVMVYEEGVVFIWETAFLVTLSDDTETIATVCLGKSEIEAPQDPLAQMALYLFDPSNERSRLTQSVQSHIEGIGRYDALLPFEEVFGITPEEAAELALEDSDMCIDAKLG